MPTQPKYAAPHITTRIRAVTEHATVLWEDPAHPPEAEAEIDLLPVQYITQRVSTRYSPQGTVGRKHVASNSQKWFPTVYLITATHSISTTHSSATGPTPMTVIAAHQQWMISCHKRNTNGEIRVETDRKPHAVCPTCNFTDQVYANTQMRRVVPQTMQQNRG
jgi:hypothetical protein